MVGDAATDQTGCTRDHGSLGIQSVGIPNCEATSDLEAVYDDRKRYGEASLRRRVRVSPMLDRAAAEAEANVKPNVCSGSSHER